MFCVGERCFVADKMAGKTLAEQGLPWSIINYLCVSFFDLCCFFRLCRFRSTNESMTLLRTSAAPCSNKGEERTGLLEEWDRFDGNHRLMSCQDVDFSAETTFYSVASFGPLGSPTTPWEPESSEFLYAMSENSAPVWCFVNGTTEVSSGREHRDARICPLDLQRLKNLGLKLPKTKSTRCGRVFPLSAVGASGFARGCSKKCRLSSKSSPSFKKKKKLRRIGVQRPHLTYFGGEGCLLSPLFCLFVCERMQTLALPAFWDGSRSLKRTQLPFFF